MSTYKDAMMERLRKACLEIRHLKKLIVEEGDEDGSIKEDIKLYEDIVQECHNGLVQSVGTFL